MPRDLHLNIDYVGTPGLSWALNRKLPFRRRWLFYRTTRSLLRFISGVKSLEWKMITI